jgi:uncharacterized protein YjiS (DUF1127 family)
MTNNSILARLREGFRVGREARHRQMKKALPDRVRLSDHLMRDIGLR